MALGPGKYDDLCTYVREQADAEVAIVIVSRGNKGSGFSMQSRNQNMTTDLPYILESMAAQIRKDTSQ